MRTLYYIPFNYNLFNVYAILLIGSISDTEAYTHWDRGEKHSLFRHLPAMYYELGYILVTIYISET